jgi:hypothetical protein
MNRLSAILGLLAIAAVSALIGARAQVIDWVPFEAAPSEFPREAFRVLHSAPRGPPSNRAGGGCFKVEVVGDPVRLFADPDGRWLGRAEE